MSWEKNRPDNPQYILLTVFKYIAISSYSWPMCRMYHTARFLPIYCPNRYAHANKAKKTQKTLWFSHTHTHTHTDTHTHILFLACARGHSSLITIRRSCGEHTLCVRPQEHTLMKLMRHEHAHPTPHLEEWNGISTSCSYRSRMFRNIESIWLLIPSIKKPRGVWLYIYAFVY